MLTAVFGVPDSRKAAATWVVDVLLLFLFGVLLVWPLFQATYLDKWSSIESTYIADARFLNENWPHPGWQPLWYCGTRYDYIYPPALRYGTALVARWGEVPPARAYHIYIAFLYALGIAGVYVSARTVSGSRGLAWLAAAATALLSPSFLFVGGIRYDAGEWLIPQRLGVLVRYGEGPHISSLALLPLALAACWRAVERFRPAALGAAAVLCALVVSHNFYGALALAFFFTVLVFSLWVTHKDWWMWARAAAIPVLAYGLTAFWLVPSYIGLTLHNLQFVSQPGKAWAAGLVTGVSVALLLLALGFARGRREWALPVYVGGSAVLLSLLVLGSYWWELRIIGEWGRLVPELDLALILLVLAAARWLWLRRATRRRWWQAAAVAIVLVGFAPARHYVLHAWKLYIFDLNHQQRVEYELARWMNDNLPGARAYTEGSVRFWYNAWFDLPQTGGGSDQGLVNSNTVSALWEIRLAEEAEPSVQWLRALGTDAIIVNDKTSRDYYRSYVYPKKFEGVLPVLYDNGQGDVIYRVPRRYPGLARVVQTQVAAALQPPRGNSDLERIGAYADALENGPESPAPTRWVGSDEVRIQARLNAGESVVLQVTYDPAWRAYSGNQRLAIDKDAMGFMRIEAAPGAHEIRVVFETPLENRIGRVVSALSGIVVVVLLGWGWRRRRETAAAA